MPGNAVIDELVSRWDELERGARRPASRSSAATTRSSSSRSARSSRCVRPISRGRRRAAWPHPRTNGPAPTQNSATASFPGALDWHDGLRPPEQAGEIGRLGPFRVMNLLGAGGMGSVYRAIDTQLGRAVALKVMQTPRADSERARARFLREARTAAAMQHDHVVSVYQFGEDNGVLYLAMPLLHGQTLRDRLKQSPPLTMAEILRIGARRPRAWPLPTSSG